MLTVFVNRHAHPVSCGEAEQCKLLRGGGSCVAHGRQSGALETREPLAALTGSAAQVPGLSAPIPPGAQFGFQPGGWGKPPVDEAGNPLYGDVFGIAMYDNDDDVRACILAIHAFVHCTVL